MSYTYTGYTFHLPWQASDEGTRCTCSCSACHCAPHPPILQVNDLGTDELVRLAAEGATAAECRPAWARELGQRSPQHSQSYSKSVIQKKLKAGKITPEIQRAQIIHVGWAGISGFRSFTLVGACRSGSKNVIQN